MAPSVHQGCLLQMMANINEELPAVGIRDLLPVLELAHYQARVNSLAPSESLDADLRVQRTYPRYEVLERVRIDEEGSRVLVCPLLFIW